MIFTLADSYQISVGQHTNPGEVTIIQRDGNEELVIVNCTFQNAEKISPNPIVLKWSIPAKAVAGIWQPNADFGKQIQPDWELGNLHSSIGYNAPVLSLFGSDDKNVLTFSVSQTVHAIELAAKYREEDSSFHCSIILFPEGGHYLDNYSIDIRLDSRKIRFQDALHDTAVWWESDLALKPAKVPEIARKPLYSTWYQFHQNLEEKRLLIECAKAKELGFEAIIIDDGWQTNDSNRGYDYTGDWQPERFPNIKNLVGKIQQLGIKVGIWYSVPFCGIKSRAYKKFRGKFLTESHRWAPVFDPRFPEVREYLVGIYSKAVRDLNLDGLKLDFIDDFRNYKDTNHDLSGRDTLNIYEAVEILLSDIQTSVKQIRPDIFIEFRQKYIGPSMRKFGNILRAFDCPGDYTMNRVRIADLKMLAGNTAVHSDMVRWSHEESVEDAAMHFINTLFGVPQISMMLSETPKTHLEMITFYTRYWNDNADLFSYGDFSAYYPLQNYPLLKVVYRYKAVYSLHSDLSIDINPECSEYDVINAKPTKTVLLSFSKSLGDCECVVRNCQGVETERFRIHIPKGINVFSIPPGGMLSISK